ncbi:YL1 nuclear protein C-terminal domain-containing protein [Cardiosporidium cionae]|uniref:YL1 nuclear protein C-terminal domain-containing protein n=1 Tax=Cardiosporidium cionae TaxID=476202 RepID=A0ABQ7JAY6_9APIC|nr:YL1 nuclear protein C-terminal domain-containing protein [Cardiosporidium cionae]|eukprot:KAF8821084.1 YL1 nuclear protein C-terminal domain-containing protein [Cardiosporidium cionae]
MEFIKGMSQKNSPKPDSISSGCNSDLSDSEEATSEEEVGIALDLPKRETRAKRYSFLLGEAREQNDEFWQHDTWAEENDDRDYNCSEGEEIYRDVIDSDFDEDESEVESESNEFMVDTEKEHRKKKNVYQDPVLVARRLAKRKHSQKLIHTNFQLFTKAKTTHDTLLSTNKGDADSIFSRERKRVTRVTTQEKTGKIAAQQLQRVEHHKVFVAKRGDSSLTHRTRSYAHTWREPTQEEHLKEAKHTEEANRKSLIALQEWEEERKKYVEYKKQRGVSNRVSVPNGFSYQGHYDVWISWASDRLILSEETSKRADLDESLDIHLPENNPAAKYYKTGSDLHAAELLIFTDGNVPPFYNKKAPQVNDSPRCVVTGNVAKYQDPVTQCFYDSAESFKILRQWYHDEQDKKIIGKLVQIENLMEEKTNEARQIN